MEKISRSFWGIQLKSFKETLKYLRMKHSQKKMKLLQIMKELQVENSRMQLRIDFSQLPFLDPVSKSTPPDVRNSFFAWDESWFESQHYFKIRFKKRLFGLNVKKVHAYITKLIRMQGDELQEIRKELSALLKKREQLLIKLSSFESTNHSEKAAASLEALVDEVHVLEGTQEKEIQQEPAFIEKESDDENIKEKIEAQIKERLLLKLKSLLLTKQTDETEEYWQEIQEIIKQKIMEGQKQGKSRRSNVIAFQHKDRRQSIPHLTSTSHKQRLTVNGTDFWGEDIEFLLFQPHIGYEDEGVAYVSDSGHSAEIIIKNDSSDQERYIESKQSPAITNQAYQLKKKYIVGKLAGADLKDSSGKIIITKNEVITEQVMNQAEQQGKLAELIVNMMIPGLSE